ncbi:hypothetical protein GOBAR_AA23603 [Gossypium barbadense]|uniref:Uncharacterized protein n=1 Tax=Gossypium barbadense TaxID=3634 RepID=A0A2P5X157_GOSBA|nr:hypothetical protein GOBAR_AA23603 [Gossypium barbadense]
MLSKFISVSKTHFQNTETALKNQQALIQGLKTQIGQLSKLISERPQGRFLSNTEPNPREQLNAINIQDDEGAIEPEPEPRQETVVSKGELTLRIGDETLTLQARNSDNTSGIEGDRLNHPIKTDHILQKISMKEIHEPFSSNSRGPVHEDRRLQIEEQDEWQTHKPRTPNKPNLRQNELDTSPNHLKVGDKVLLDAANPYIVTTILTEEIPFMILNIFPFGTVEVSHPMFGTFKVFHRDTTKHKGVLMAVRNRIRLSPNTGCDKIPRPCDMAVVEPVKTTREYTMSSSRGKKTAILASKKRKGVSSSAGLTTEIRHPLLQFPRGLQEELFQILRARPLIVGHCIDWAAVEQTLMINYDDPGTVQFCLGQLIRQLSVLEFGAALGLYTEEFKEENNLDTLSRHIHFSFSKCWHTLVPGAASYNPRRSKASVLPPFLRYLHAVLAHTITGRRESTGVINTHDAYFLWCMYVIDLAYFIVLTIQHQMERHRKGVISISPYVTRLVRHFGLLNTAAQESSLTLIGQMSPQGISSMLSMRRSRGAEKPALLSTGPTNLATTTLSSSSCGSFLC